MVIPSTETLHILTSVKYSGPLPILEAKKLLLKVQVVVEDVCKTIEFNLKTGNVYNH